MKRFYFIAFVLVTLFAVNAEAQSKEHKGVVMHTDPRLGLLLKKSYAANTSSVSKAPKAPGVTTDKLSKVDHTPVATERVFTTTMRKARTIYSGQGFRVQIYNGPDRNKAMEIKTEFMRRNPGVRTYLTYISPSFRVKVGNYRSRNDAQGMYKEARSTYTPCMIVPDIITISTF